MKGPKVSMSSTKKQKSSKDKAKSSQKQSGSAMRTKGQSMKAHKKPETKAQGKASAAPTKGVAKSGKSKSTGGISLPPGASLSRISLSGAGSKAGRSDAGRTGSALTDQVCREAACDGLATSSGYCRLHYLKNWKKIKRREMVLKEGRLNQYIEELVAKYPDKYIDAIRSDLASEKDFTKVVRDLELDESLDDFDGENDSIESIIDNIRRDIDDEGDAF